MMAVVTDRKITVQGANISCFSWSKPMTDFYIPNAVSYSDYYPFGAILYGRNWSSERYRFNGQEKNDEVSGEGNSYTAEFWQYSSRLAVRWNLDPVFKPFQSSYVTFMGNPIIFVDRKGDTEYIAIKVFYNDGKEQTIKMSISNKIITDGHVTMVGMSCCPVNKNHYYDFTNQITYRQNADGDFETSYQTIYHKDKAKASRTVWISSAKKGHTINDSDDKTWERGCIEFTSKDGRGNNTLTKNTDAKSENIDMLINALGGLVVKGFVNKNPTISADEILEKIKRVTDAYEKIEQLENLSLEDNKPAGTKESNDIGTGIEPLKGDLNVEKDSVLMIREGKIYKRNKDDTYGRNPKEVQFQK